MNPPGRRNRPAGDRAAQKVIGTTTASMPEVDAGSYDRRVAEDLLAATAMRFRLAGASFRWRCTVCRLSMTSEAAAVAHVLATRHLVAGSMTSVEHIGDPSDSDRLQHREGWL